VIYEELHIFPNAREASQARAAAGHSRNSLDYRYATAGNPDALLGVRTKKLVMHDRGRCYQAAGRRDYLLQVVEMTAVRP